MQNAMSLERYVPQIEAELQTVLESRRLPLYDMHRYHLGWTDAQGKPVARKGGKLLRSALCLSSCRAAGGSPEKALPAAAAVELVHNFSLVHDDIEDGSDYRRHQPAVWKVWGAPQAINAGDSMYALAHVALMRLHKTGVPTDRVLRAEYVLAETCLKLCEGQYLDISFEGRTEVGLPEYLNMISLKTGALMGAASQLGAIAATVDESVVKSLLAFGLKLGLAFQIQDDIMGAWGKTEKTGKPLYDDITGRKMALPVVYTLSVASEAVRQELLEVYRRGPASAEEAAKVARILADNGARDYCIQQLKSYHREAMDELVDVPDREGIAELDELARFVLGQARVDSWEAKR